MYSRLFFFNDTATTEIYTLSLHDALPISSSRKRASEPFSAHSAAAAAASAYPSAGRRASGRPRTSARLAYSPDHGARSEEHTSELQSHSDLVCRFLLEKKTYT